MIPGPPSQRRSLLADGSLLIDVAPVLLPLVRSWLPRLPAAPEAVVGEVAESVATIEVVAGPPLGIAPPASEPTLELGAVAAYVAPQSDGVLLRACSGSREGLVDLAGLRATLRAEAESDEEAAAADLHSMLTVSAALLLGRLRRALLHAAAVVSPAGDGWLLAGDARSGKSTSCANLIQAGWGFLSDDQVVLYRNAAADSLRIEGWPRQFHLDEGWKDGVPDGRRVTLDPFALRSDAWQRTAALRGVVLTEVRPERATELAPLAPAEALVGLIRQSPWLLADRTAAAEILELLRQAASGPAFRLYLGRDTYGDPERLLDCLRPLLRDS